MTKEGFPLLPAQDGATGNDRIISKQIAFATPWFEVVAKRTAGDAYPYYALRMTDYVSVVAFTPADDLVLVRQYRPVVERYTLELPSGHVEKNETPLESAKRELAEECGLTGEVFELVGTLISDTGRNENRLWCYLARKVFPTPDFKPEPGLERILVPRCEVSRILATGQLDHALNLAALMMAVARHGAGLIGLT